MNDSANVELFIDDDVKHSRPACLSAKFASKRAGNVLLDFGARITYNSVGQIKATPGGINDSQEGKEEFEKRKEDPVDEAPHCLEARAQGWVVRGLSTGRC